MRAQQSLKKILYLFSLLFSFEYVQAQRSAATTDTTGRKIIIINHADKLGFKEVDSLNKFQLLVGNVAVQQEKTLFYCDSAAINTGTNVLEAFGHVHINDNDSLHIYSDFLTYFGKEKKAILTSNVKLTDGKGVLTTTRLDYDLQTKIGIYSQGGEVVNDKTVLTSQEGYYYEETRDIYFKKDVVLVDSDYNIKTDTLLYNTYSAVATFVVPTLITSDSGRKKINTTDGYYDSKNKKAYFGKRPEIQDGSTFLIADEVANDDSTGFGEAKGNVRYRDTAQKVTIIANHMNTNRKNKSFLATEKPIMIIKQEDDSIFIAADTLYSAKLSDLRKHKIVSSITESAQQKDSAIRDEIDNKETDSLHDKPSAFANKSFIKMDSSRIKDSAFGKKSVQVDSLQNKDSAFVSENSVKLDSSNKKDSVLEKPFLKTDSLQAKETAAVKGKFALMTELSASEDTIVRNGNDSTDRFFEAYYHVRIYSDSLQAVGDSLFYSGEDSVFRLFKQPIVWARESQVTGDTIYLYTQNKKPARLYAFENALTVNKVGPNYYNQVKGRTINGYFKNGNIDFMRAKGNSESVYYAQDEENKYIGVNRATADIIDMYFEEKKPERVVFRSNLVGTTYPMRQVNHEELRLRGFKWQDELRPKTKYELFGN